MHALTDARPADPDHTGSRNMGEAVSLGEEREPVGEAEANSWGAWNTSNSTSEHRWGWGSIGSSCILGVAEPGNV